MDRINALEIFTKIVESNSFSIAAWKMNLAPGTLSKTIQKLEAELGFKLFNRTTKKITLTQQGENYYPLAKEIIEKFNASKLIKNSELAISGIIRIAAPSYFPYLYLIKPLEIFLKKYPHIKIEFVQKNSPALVSTNEADIAFSNYKIMDSKLHQELLLTEERVLIAAPKYIKQRGTPKNINELNMHDCLVNTLLYPEGFWEFGKQKIAVNARIFSNDALYIIEAAKAGLGIMWTIPLFVKEALARKELEILDFSYPTSNFHLYLAHPISNKTDKTTLLVDFLKKNLALINKS